MKIKVLVNLDHDNRSFKKDQVIEGESVDFLLPSLENLLKKKYIVVLEDEIHEKEPDIEEKRPKKKK